MRLMGAAVDCGVCEGRHERFEIIKDNSKVLDYQSNINHKRKKPKMLFHQAALSLSYATCRFLAALAQDQNNLHHCNTLGENYAVPI